MMAPTPMTQALDLLEAAWRRTAVLNRKMIGLAHSNLRFGFELARAKTLSDVLSLQADYWQNQWNAFQAEDVGNELPEAVEPRRAETVKPKRAEASEPRSVAAAASERAEAVKPRGAEAAALPGPLVRPQAETPQAEAKPVESPVVDAPEKVVAEAAEKPKQTSAKPVESPVAEAAEKPKQTSAHKPARKAAASAPQADSKSTKGRPKPAQDRPSSTKARAPERKGRARGQGAIAPSGTDRIQFGMLDGNPVRFTSVEAWALVDGAWKRVPVDEVLSDAAVLSQARFDKLYPGTPELPTTAFKPKGGQKK